MSLSWCRTGPTLSLHYFTAKTTLCVQRRHSLDYDKCERRLAAWKIRRTTSRPARTGPATGEQTRFSNQHVPINRMTNVSKSRNALISQVSSPPGADQRNEAGGRCSVRLPRRIERGTTVECDACAVRRRANSTRRYHHGVRPISGESSAWASNHYSSCIQLADPWLQKRTICVFWTLIVCVN